MLNAHTCVCVIWQIELNSFVFFFLRKHKYDAHINELSLLLFVPAHMIIKIDREKEIFLLARESEYTMKKD